MATAVVLLAIAAASCGNDSGPRWSDGALLDDELGFAACGDIAMDAGGNAMAVWCRHSEDYEGSVWASRFTTSDGWSIATRIDARVGTEVLRPRVAVNGAGEAIAVWMKHDEDRVWGISAAHFDPGSGWGDAVRFEQFPYLGDPDVALNDEGHGIVVFTRWDGESNQSGIWMREIRRDDGWSVATRLDEEIFLPDSAPDPFLDGSSLPTSVSFAERPRIAMNDAGDAVVVWSWSNWTSSSLWASRYVRGSGWTAQTRLDEPALSFMPTHLAIDEAGRAIAVSRGGAASLYTPTDGWSLTALSDAGFGARTPNVAMAPNGQALVVWREEREGVGVDLLASRFTPETGWTPPELIGEADDDGNSYGDSTGSDLAITERGEALVLWHRERGEYSEALHQPRFSIWANRFEPGKGWESAIPLSTYDLGHAVEPQLAMDEQGRAIATWQQVDVETERRSTWWSRFE
jgi:hypothetical protein